MGHCAVDASLGPDDFDLLSVLEAWVEQGVGPQPITAAEQSEEGKVVRTRLLCPYPERAAFNGGDQSKAGAKDFRCVEGEPIKIPNGELTGERHAKTAKLDFRTGGGGLDDCGLRAIGLRSAA